MAATGSSVQSSPVQPGVATAKTFTPRRAPAALHDQAVALGRAGNFPDSIRIFASLTRDYPDDLDVRRDYCAVLSWAQHYRDSVNVYASLPPDQPDYVLIAAAFAYRRLNQFREAFDLYQAGYERFPDEVQFVAGQSLTETDAKQPKQGLALATQALTANKDSVPLLLAAGYASLALRQPTSALGYYDQVLRLDPQNREARQQQASATAQLRAAHKKAGNHSPGNHSQRSRR